MKKINAVAMVRHIRDKQHEDIAVKSPQEIIDYFRINRNFGGVGLTKPFCGHSCAGRNPEHRVSFAKRPPVVTHAS